MVKQNMPFKQASSTKDRDIMRTYLKKQGFETKNDRIVFILNTRDSYLKRAAIKRGWFENPVPNSQLFDMKWDYTDNQQEFNNLKGF